MQNSNHLENPTSSPDPVPLDVLGLSNRAYNCLRRAGFRFIADIASLSDEQLLGIRNLGAKTLAEIRGKIQTYLDGHSINKQKHTSKSVLSSSSIESQDLEDGVSIVTLQLSSDVRARLKLVGVTTVEQLAHMSPEHILDVPYLSEESLTEIESALENYFVEHLPFGCSFETEEFSFANVPLGTLGLSTRVHNALMRSGVRTVNQLAQMSSKRILEVRNLGRKSLTEIGEKLEAYLVKHPLPLPELPAAVDSESECEPASPLVAPELLARIVNVPLDDISVNRLALSPSLRNLLRIHGVESLGELTQRPAGTFDRNSPIVERLNRYLNWLVEQDESIWASEVVGQTFNPLYWMELSQTSLDDLIEGWFSSLGNIDERDRYVIYWRYGLYDERLTLEEAGNRLGVSRERARQLEKRALNHLSMPQHCVVIRPLVALLVYLLEQAGSLMNEEQVNAALQQEVVVNNIDSIGVVHLVFEINNDVKWLRGTKAWGLKSAPLDEVLGVQKRLARILEKERVPLSVEETIARFKSTRFYRNRQEKLEHGFILACLRVHPEISIDEEDKFGLKQWEHHRLNETILALREVGEPVHYTVIAERTNALLEPEVQTSAHNIHAHMQRQPDIFVRVGHGIYGLAEWGLHDDGSLANAAHRVLSEAGKPLHQDIIADQVLETWKARRSSVYMALQTDDRFVRIGSGVYWLREKITEEGNVEKADFGDLFGKRLEQLQDEMNVEEGISDYDTHAEADAIRQMGTDFFK